MRRFLTPECSVVLVVLLGLLLVCPTEAVSAPPTPRPGEPLPRIACLPGYEAFVYAQGLSKPDGLAVDPDGTVYVAEEKAGRVSRIEQDGAATPIAKGLTLPEGIDLDPAGNLYVVEDVQNGRLLRVAPDGRQTSLADGRNGPEGVVWAPDGSLYITESNVQFAAEPPWDFVTGITRVSPDGEVTTVLTNTLFWSYSAITLGADGQLYVANEASNVGTTDSVFRVDLTTGARTLFASDLTAPEGLTLSPGGFFPLYVAEEDLGEGHGRLSLVQADGKQHPVCTGFGLLEDVAADRVGNLYLSEDSTGLIVRITAPDLTPPPQPQRLVADPAGWTASNAFALRWENPLDTSGIAGAYLKLDAPPTFGSDGAFFAGEHLTQIVSITVAGAGAHPAYLWLADDAGNARFSDPATATLHYDPDPPGRPGDLAVDPAGWTPREAFTLTWTNPPEVSGVMAACFQLGGADAGTPEPQTCHVAAGASVLAAVPVAHSGAYSVSVWLVDAAGNTDPATAARGTLRRDAVPPESSVAVPTRIQAAPIPVTWAAADAHSGVEAVTLWVKMGDGGAWVESGLSSRAGGSGLFLYQPGGAGLYHFATVAIDRAGNAEAVPVGSGDAQTLCETWQRAYLPLFWRSSP